MRTTIRILTLMLLASLFLAACDLPTNAVPFAVGPTSWIDSPLNGAHLPIAPVVLVGHGYDNASVSQFEWSVNGAVVNTLPPSDANGKLFNNQASWTPDAPGNYTISLRVNGSGGWSAPISVVITIGDFREKVVTPVLLPPADITTPTPTPLPLQTATLSFPEAIAHLNLNCHRGPDIAFDSDGTLFKGVSARILATNPDKNWLQIENPQVKGNRCWVLRASVDITGDTTTITVTNGPPLPVAKQPPAKPNSPTAIPPTPCPGPVINGICYSP